MPYTKEQQKIYSHNYYESHKDIIKANYEKDKEIRTERAKKYYKDNKEKCRKLQKRWALNNKVRVCTYSKKHRKKLKNEILKHYGNGICACVICGENRLDCLSIDHINGSGAKHRREIGILGSPFYPWLKRNNFPSGYQTLCMNCQWIKHLS